MSSVGNSTAAPIEPRYAHAGRLEGWRTASTLPGLLDVSVVRAELARFRAPRPATAISERFELRSSPLTARDLDRA
jgi:hypothetical protein